jgi:hypothetical protein
MRQKFYVYPFGVSGDQTVIPDPTQVSGSVSFQSGWPYDYQRQIGVDPLALPIDRATMNWLFYTITEQLQQYQEFGFPEWISTTDNGGTPFAYDFGAVVRYSATGNPPFTTYISVVAGAGTNTSTPGADANWRVWSPTYLYQAAGVPTGALNGVNTTYTLPQTPVGSVALFVNGLYQTPGVDYTLAGATITYLNTPLTATESIAFGEYRY